jgi:archaea-specific DNA-binding protein
MAQPDQPSPAQPQPQSKPAAAPSRAPQPNQGRPNNPQGQQRGDRREDRRERPQGERQPRSPKDRNTVFIGNKPPMNYVLAVVTQFNQNEPEVVIRARGKAISQAVDVAEIVRNKFYSKCSVKVVTIGTEQVMSEDGRRRSVSAIEIRLQNDDVGAKPAAGGAAANLPQAGAPQKAPAEPATPQKSAGV